MKDNETIKKLDELAKINEVCVSFQQELGGLIEQAFLNCPDLKERYDEIQIELEALTPRRSVDIKLITAYVLGKQESVKGKNLQAVFSKGRTSWDPKALIGYAVAHPEINEFKKVGKPSVSIREVKDSKKD